MTKDSNENSTSSSSFRDQILRDLESLKVGRSTETPAVEPKEEVKASLQFKQEVEQSKQASQTAQAKPVSSPQSNLASSASIKLGLDILSFNQEYLTDEDEIEQLEEKQPLSEEAPVVETPVESKVRSRGRARRRADKKKQAVAVAQDTVVAEPIIAESVVEPVIEESVVEPLVEETILPPLEELAVEPIEDFGNTVERNLAELRSLAQEKSLAFQSKEESLVEETVTGSPTNFSMKDFLAERSQEEEPTPVVSKEEFVQKVSRRASSVRSPQALPSESVDQTGLEDTIIASSLPVAKNEEVGEPELQARRRSVSKQQRKKQEKTAKRIVSSVIVVVLVALAITSFAGYSYVKSSLEPVNAEATTPIQVEIPEGASTKEIGQILADSKLVKNATVFNYYAKLKSYNNFQSGYYNLTQSMSVDDIAKALQESGSATAIDPTAGKVLIVEGYTLTQIADAITKNAATEEDTEDTTPFTAEQFMATVQNPDFINRMVATYPNLFASLPAADSGVVYQLEGYLFPAIYEYNSDTTIEYLVEQMIAAMNSRLEPYYAQIAEKGQTVNEILTLASLVEKEGSTDEDRRNIASVFYNRIAAEMPLQSNIAILYAMGKLGQETTLAEDAAIDTSIESPYNIYWNAGLMPGPVDSPSLSAIEATINPNATEYYYFVADVTTGIVYYATNIDDHNVNVETYVNSHLNN